MSALGDAYDNLSTQYSAFEDLPTYKIEWQLTERALSNCNGKTVLDLGGGTGLHARQAIDLGAKSVDVIDISSGMLEEGKAISSKLGRKDPIRWFVGNMLESLDELPLEKGYDIVLVGWTFDNAETDQQLEAMWKIVSRYAKPGGFLINLRVANVHSTAAESGKYGVKYTDIREAPGGFHYKYNATTESAFSCPGTTMRASMDFEQAKKLAEKYGFTNYRIVPAEDLSIVNSDPEFWNLFLHDPFMVCAIAEKKE